MAGCSAQSSCQLVHAGTLPCFGGEVRLRADENALASTFPETGKTDRDHMGYAKWNSGEGNREGGSESRRGDSVTASVNRLQIQANYSHQVANQVLVHLRWEMKP